MGVEGVAPLPDKMCTGEVGMFKDDRGADSLQPIIHIQGVGK